MGLPAVVEAQNQVARFKLMLNCYNCRRPAAQYAHGVPSHITTEDDLIESGVLDRQVFTCPKCEARIGTITGIKIEWLDVPY